ncbi:hypothetical protein [Azospirillum brasilense]|uniref:hypothetical protein n=1 Tax=Azospirillum brasilense TaxID=192 RepID=UPI001178174A|nr:hypothetical protein [Azospirillum brasilense]
MGLVAGVLDQIERADLVIGRALAPTATVFEKFHFFRREVIQPVFRKIGQPHGPGLGQFAVSLSTSMLGCSPTNAWIVATTGWASSSMRCSPLPASLSSRPASLSSENRA